MGDKWSTWPGKPIEQPELLLRQPESALVQVKGEPVVMLRGPVHNVAKHEHEAGKEWGEWLPVEFHLWELRDVDLDDADAVLVFVQTWGDVRLAHMGPHFLEHFGWKADVAKTRRTFAAIEKAAREAGHEGAPLPVAEVRYVLGALRDAVAAIVTYSREGEPIQETRDLLDAGQAHFAEWRPISGGSRRLALHEKAPEDVRGMFIGQAVDLVNSGLGVFTPRLVLGRHNAAQRVLPFLYNVLCLGIYNDIAQRSPYRVCKRCGRVFVRQRGRAKYDQHKRRGELKYCSAACSNAAAVAASRKRARERKQKEGGGK